MGITRWYRRAINDTLRRAWARTQRNCIVKSRGFLRCEQPEKTTRCGGRRVE